MKKWRFATREELIKKFGVRECIENTPTDRFLNYAETKLQEKLDEKNKYKIIANNFHTHPKISKQDLEDIKKYMWGVERYKQHLIFPFESYVELITIYVRKNKNGKLEWSTQGKSKVSVKKIN